MHDLGSTQFSFDLAVTFPNFDWVLISNYVIRIGKDPTIFSSANEALEQLERRFGSNENNDRQTQDFFSFLILRC